MRDEAIALVVALKGHTLPKEAENALNRLCNALSQQKHDQVVCSYCKNSATLGAVFFDQNCYGCVKRMTNTPKREPLTPQSPCEMTQAEYKIFKLGWLECESAHGIRGET